MSSSLDLSGEFELSQCGIIWLNCMGHANHYELHKPPIVVVALQKVVEYVKRFHCSVTVTMTLFLVRDGLLVYFSY